MKIFLSKISPEAKSIALIIMTVLLFSTQDAIAKNLIQSYPPIQVVWSRYTSQTVVSLIILLPIIGTVLKTKNVGIQLLRSTFLFVATFCFFSSLKYLQLAQVNAVFQVAPLFVTALSVFVLRESVGVRRWGGVFVGMLGAIIIIRPGSTTFSLALILPIGAALSYASYLIATKYLSNEEAATTNFLYTSLIGFVLASFLAPTTWTPINPSDLFTFFSFGLLGALGHLFIILAFRLIDASFLAPFTYLQLIFASFWGVYLFAEIPDKFTIIGGVLIVFSGLYVWLREQKHKP
ncbi:MAG: DMT family transporter [Paracoccaceae bacterium]|nr:DMT family transporter [Paracoccaceae bacterium]